MDKFKQLFLTEKNILWMIAINSVIIFLLYFPQIRGHSPVFYRGLEYLDAVCVLIFLIEAIVKLREFGIKRYFEDAWNSFDFLIVLGSLPTLLIFFPLSALPFSTSILKILRLGRMIRLFRLMTFIPRMNVIVAGLGRAMKASVFIFLALLLCNFVIALSSCHFFGPRVPEMFGDPLVSMFYIFQMFTVEGWNEVPATVSESFRNEGSKSAFFSANTMEAFTRFYFIVIVTVGGLFGMSLANAVFVDEMTSDNNDEIKAQLDAVNEQLEELKSMLERKT